MEGAIFLSRSGVWSVAVAVLIAPLCHASILLFSVSVFMAISFLTGTVRYECEQTPRPARDSERALDN